MKTIKLTQGKFTLVDDEDYEEFNKHKWYASKEGYVFYAQRSTYNPHKILRMHREILNALPTQQIDHINGNGIDNRKSNLRFCNHSQNQGNQTHKKRIGTSKYRGVHWAKKDKFWVSGIVVNGEKQHLGSYFNEEAAAKAYDRAARKHFGDFAIPNFP